jgi:hypothetical protein
LQYETLISAGTVDVISDIKVAYSKVADLEQSGFLNLLIQTYQKINSANFEYISPSLKAGKDVMTVTINITAKDGLPCTNNYSRFNGEYTGKVYGFKVNFSSGLFIIGGKNTFDHTYRLDPIAGNLDSNIIKQNDNKNVIFPAIGALMHFYMQQPSWFSWGGAFGLSINNSTSLNYHGGLSFLFGDEQRIVVSGGVTLTQIKLISDEYMVGQIVPKSITTIPTSSFYRWGYFFSLTYNLSN